MCLCHLISHLVLVTFRLLDLHMLQLLKEMPAIIHNQRVNGSELVPLCDEIIRLLTVCKQDKLVETK